MGKLSKLALDINDFLNNKSENKKIVVALTGDCATGKTTIGLILKEFFKDIVFFNSDNFRRKIIWGTDKKKNYKNFVSSYQVPPIKKIISSFLKDPHKKILLLEMPFVFDKYFDILPIDYIIELKSSQKDIKKRRELRGIKKIDKSKFDNVLLIYKSQKRMHKKLPKVVSFIN